VISARGIFDSIREIFALAWPLVPLVLAAIPLGTVEQGPTLCLIKNFTGHACPGCGMTRAVFAALQLHWEQAWHFNRGIVLVLPLLAWEWVKLLRTWSLPAWRRRIEAWRRPA